MMNVSQIVDYVENRLKELNEMNDLALNNIMRTDIEPALFDMWEAEYDDTFNRMTELRKLLRAINEVPHDSDP